jgi:ADP-ribose pyrophosphatase YjhB (NUDIX family)
MSLSVRVAPKALIIDDGRLLVLEMLDDEGPWYLLPGGGQRHGETLAEALRRECREEIGAEIEVGPVLLIRDYIGRNHEFAWDHPDAHQLEIMFLCSLADGHRPGSGTRPDDGQQGVTWLRLDEIEQHRFYPLTLRPTLRAGIPNVGAAYLGDIN